MVPLATIGTIGKIPMVPFEESRTHALTIFVNLLHIIIQAIDLVRYIMLDYEPLAAPCDNICLKKNIIDSPECVCGSIEDTRHFLLVCNQYAVQKRDLINSVSDICRPTLNAFLFGDQTLTREQNNRIFLAVHEFIMKTKRFEN